METVGYGRIEMDAQGSRVRIPAGTTLDLGGIAKGYVVQKATEMLRQAGVSRAIINAGEIFPSSVSAPPMASPGAWAFRIPRSRPVCAGSLL